MRRNARLPLIILLLFMPLIALLNLMLGASGLSLAEIWQALILQDTFSRSYVILMHIRLPRLLGALLTGGSLAAAGYILQNVLGNPMASPGLIGVNSGAGLMALIAMIFLPQASAAVPLLAFLGALLAALLVYFVSAVTGASKSTLILSGVAISALLGACMDALVTFFPDAAISRSAFSIGGFENITLSRIFAVCPFVFIGIGLAAFFSRELSILSMGDETASGLGLSPILFRFLFLIAAALLSAAAVSLGGLIGFVGLIAPHIARLMTPGQNKGRLPLSILCGMALCALCDLIARTAFAPYELPVGILLALLGVPFFLSLLFGQKRRNRHDHP